MPPHPSHPSHPKITRRRLIPALLLLPPALSAALAPAGCGGGGGGEDVPDLYSFAEQNTGQGDGDFRVAVHFTNDPGQFVADVGSRSVLFGPDGSGREILPDGGGSFTLLGLNNRGQVAGVQSLPGGGASRSFLWSAEGGTVVLGGAGAAFSARALDDAGRVAGVLTLAGGGQRVALREPDGALLDIGAPAPGAGGLSIAGINARGEVAGSYAPAEGGSLRGFVWRRDGAGSGTFTDLGKLPGRAGDALVVAHINATGKIVGASQPPDSVIGAHAFLWDPTSGAITDLTEASRDGRLANAVAVTEQGHVVAAPRAEVGGEDAFALLLYRDGRVYEPERFVPAGLGWEELSVDSVNGRGQLFGSGLLNGAWRRFVLTPK